MKKCKDVMTRDPECCLATDPVTKVAQLMKREDVGSVPVVDQQNSKRLIGIVTDRDLVLNVLAEGTDYRGAIVQQAMSRNLVTCLGEDGLEHAMHLMSQHQIRRIPVVDGEQRVMGIISQADVATRVDEPEKTADILEDISQPK